MAIYGKEFAAVYDEKWEFFAATLWPFLARQVARRNPRARTWLDLCCGNGALLKHACTAGFEAVGVDLSPHQLAFARKNAPRAELLRADARSLALGRQFDVASCTFDSLNYITNKRDLARVFANVRRHLNPGGVFLFDVNTPAGLAKLRGQTAVERSPRFTVIVEPKYDASRRLDSLRITGFIKEGQRYRKFEEEHFQRGYPQAQLEEMLQRAGFAGLRKYDGYTLSRPKQTSGRLIFVCHRK